MQSIRGDRQGNAHPFAIEEEEQLVVDNRAAHTASKVIHCGPWFVISWIGIREIVGAGSAWQCG